MQELNFHIVIPAHNEAQFLGETLSSLVSQTHKPKQLVIVNDNSTDQTLSIAETFSKDYSFITVVSRKSSAEHLPGSKVISAFNVGLKLVPNDADIICKFDADLIFPSTYLETLNNLFISDTRIGMASGNLYVKEADSWVYEAIADKNHIRGPIKAYRKNCFKDIGGLKTSIGWDTVDVLLAKYHNWKTITDTSLKVKHLKPTGATYSNKGYEKQGEAMYKMDYGFVITCIASLKIAIKRSKLSVFVEYLKGYFNAKNKKLPKLVTQAEGKFIRAYRWQGIKQKLF